MVGIYKAKSSYIKTQLHQNTRNPKTFWRIIRGLLDPSIHATNDVRFINPATGEDIETGGEANFLDDYFINIVRNLNIYNHQPRLWIMFIMSIAVFASLMIFL